MESVKQLWHALGEMNVCLNRKKGVGTHNAKKIFIKLSNGNELQCLITQEMYYTGVRASYVSKIIAIFKLYIHVLYRYM